MKIPFPLAPFFKRFVPESLFARALLILVIPALLVQLVAVFIFYERHWDNVTKHMSTSLIGEVDLILHQMSSMPKDAREEFVATASKMLGIRIELEPYAGGAFKAALPTPELKVFASQLDARIRQPFEIKQNDSDEVVLRILSRRNETVMLTFSIKRLVSATTSIFIFGMLGTAIILTLVATLFLRNQIRPIIRLARAAEQFGRGFDSPSFRPHGALEVRQAGLAFTQMKERLQRLIKSRVEMLAAISHDLRTPITRMKLQLGMMADCADVQDMKSDLSDMEHMIAEYLNFAKGETTEVPEKRNLNAVVSQVVETYVRQNKAVSLITQQPIDLMLRPQAFSRALANVIDNALRYGKRCEVRVVKEHHHAAMFFDDEGPGIAKEFHETVFQPFKRLEPSRNSQTGGVGLGLTIVQDIVHSHGGEVELLDAPSGGLRVKISLPL